MKKHEKKIEKVLREGLTEVCETALDEVQGFKWITHLADYNDFPSSLSVVCVFDTNDDLSGALNARKDDYLCSLIKEMLSAVDIHIKAIRRHVKFDTEKACNEENGGRWHERFNG